MRNNLVNENVMNASLTGALFRKTYLWMTFALFITAISSLIVVKNHALAQMILGSGSGMWVLLIAEIALVVFLTSRIHKMSLATAASMFVIYSILNGATLSVIFFVYDIATISQTFFVTAATFAAISVYGYVTKADLSKLGNILLMALIGLIIATVVNLFMKSGMLSLIISYVGVLVFVGLTAWDTQKLKELYSEATDMNDSMLKIALLGALTLYLDFINLFLYLLRIFGSSRD